MEFESWLQATKFSPETCVRMSPAASKGDSEQQATSERDLHHSYRYAFGDSHVNKPHV
jgi:hypothetical protein